MPRNLALAAGGVNAAAELAEAGLPFVMALKPRRGTWAYGADAHTRWTRPAPWPGTGRRIPATGPR
jgi:hypothetical protein